MPIFGQLKGCTPTKLVAPAHRARMTQAKIQELYGVEVLPHPPYSPDIASSDYSLFGSMATLLRGLQLKMCDDVKRACRNFFA